MKKIFYLFSVLAIALCFYGCKKDETTTFVKVTVTKQSAPKSGETVYMFYDNHGPSTAFFTPFFADKQSVTESDGVATFELSSSDVADGQTTLYFGVFTGNSPLTYQVVGTVAVTVKKGETKTAAIAL